MGSYLLPPTCDSWLQAPSSCNICVVTGPELLQRAHARMAGRAHTIIGVLLVYVALAGLLVPPFGLAAATVTAFVYGRRFLTRR